MTRENKVYHFLFPLYWLLVSILWRPKITGKQNIPAQGAFIAYANHISALDAVFMVYAMGRRNKMHILAKASLFKLRFTKWFFDAIGLISVDRSISDLTAVKRSLAYLKNGEKLGIFPEGTRVREGEDVEAKTGAARFAEKMNVPLLPLCITQRRYFFGRQRVIIGEPFYINEERKKLAPEDFVRISEEMMDKIRELGK